MENLFTEYYHETFETTHVLLESGLSPEEIAKKRELSIQTIYNHIANLFYQGKIVRQFP